MLSKSTRKRIKEQKMQKHSNPSQLIKRVKYQSTQAIKDLTLIADNLEEKDLEEIFSADNLEPLIISILKPETLRTLETNHLLADRCALKLSHSLPNTLQNSFGRDIFRSFHFTELALALWKEPKLSKK